MRPIHLTNFLLLLSVVSLMGCASLAKFTEKAEETAARGVKNYCVNFPYEVRKSVIEPRFNAAVAPDIAVIQCYGDPENPKK